MEQDGPEPSTGLVLVIRLSPPRDGCSAGYPEAKDTA